MVVISVFPVVVMSVLVPVLMAVMVVRTTASGAVIPAPTGLGNGCGMKRCR
jgi:hypothetical protein